MSSGTQVDPLLRMREVLRRLKNRVSYAAGHAPARIAIMVFVTATLLLTGLLSLPVASANGTRTELPDALFTAVSAVTVTGLTTVDTGEHWSMFGQVVILVAIQTGALGVVTIALLLTMMVTRRLGLSGLSLPKRVSVLTGSAELGIFCAWS